MMKYAQYVIPSPEVLSGAGVVKELANRVKQDGVSHVLLVTDKVLMELGLPQGLLDALTEQGVEYSVYDSVEPNPSIDSVEAIRALYKEKQCNGIIAFGGGSAMDAAKVAGARVRYSWRDVRKMTGAVKFLLLPMPKFYCVPTTSGTGAEATIAAVITDKVNKEKVVVKAFGFVPRIAVLDPELTVNLPKPITAATGMDALTHAVESYVGVNGTPFSDERAEQATRLIMTNLLECYHNGQNLDARKNMAEASLYAGEAFTRAYVGYVHAIAHAFGGLYGVPHGLANAVVMPYILDFYLGDRDDKLAELAAFSGIERGNKTDGQMAAEFIAKVRAMNKEMSIPETIEALQKEDIPMIAERAMAEAHPEYPVPKFMNEAQCEEILEKMVA
jgi:alcohol dehydrogenase class IV